MITSLHNPLVKQCRQLHQGKYRHRHQQLLLEGTHLIMEACAVRYPLLMVYSTPAWQGKNPVLYQHLQEIAEHLESVSETVLAALATTQTPDGIVAIAPRRPTSSLELHSLGLVLEGIQDPGNLGTLIRTAAAAGVEGIYLGPGCVDLEHPKVLRASAGQWFRLGFRQSSNLSQDLAPYQTSPDWQIIATRPSPNSCNYWDVNYGQPTIFLLGSEGQGLSPELLTQASQEVYIPQAPGVESLNVGVAAALLLYEVKRQRRNQSQST